MVRWARYGKVGYRRGGGGAGAGVRLGWVHGRAWPGEVRSGGVRRGDVWFGPWFGSAGDVWSGGVGSGSVCMCLGRRGMTGQGLKSLQI